MSYKIPNLQNTWQNNVYETLSFYFGQLDGINSFGDIG
jgi:hypothetical protein